MPSVVTTLRLRMTESALNSVIQLRAVGTWAVVGGILLIAVTLWDAFETIILSRRVSRKLRLSRLFYWLTWSPWRALALRMRPGNPRENYLSVYGPLSLILLLVLWAVGLIFAFALLDWGLGARLSAPQGTTGFSADLYMSGTTFFTLGYGDMTPAAPAGRALAVIEAGLGFVEYESTRSLRWFVIAHSPLGRRPTPAY